MAFQDVPLGQPLLIASAVITASLIYYTIKYVTAIIYNLYFHPLAKFPGPSQRAALPFIECWSMMTGKSHIDTQKLHDTYGPVVRIMPNALSFTTAQAWKDIYGSRRGKAQLQKQTAHLTPSNPTNIIAANDTDHARIRKSMSHAFSSLALREQEPIITFYFDLLVARLRDQADGIVAARVDIMSWYTFTSFDIIGDLTLGESFHCLENADLHQWPRNLFPTMRFMGMMRFLAVYPFINRTFKFLMANIPSLAEKRKANLEYARTKMETRLDHETDRNDFIAYIHRHNDDCGMTREEIISSTPILLLAGSETVATLLSGATYHLLQKPSILKRLQDEVRSAFHIEKDINLETVGDSARFPYMEAVLTESLRLYPPSPGLSIRMTGSGGDVIDGNFIPPRTSVGVHQWATNHSGANFADPDSFIPERWLPDPPERYRADDRAALQPFSVGPRNCIGRNLAWFEMRSILARMLWNFDMTLCEESRDWAGQEAYLLWDKPSLWVNLSRRA